MRWTIRAKLITLVLGVLALLAAGAAWSFWLDLRAARAQSQEALLAVARGSAHQIDVILSGRIESLQTLASVRVLERLEPHDLVELTQQAQATQPFVAGFLVVNPEGARARLQRAGGAALPAVGGRESAPSRPR